MLVLQPKRRVDQYAIEAGRQGAQLPVAEGLRDEAISFYQAASHAFDNGLYLDEEQLIPEKRIATTAPR
jgi:hypothetical protein